MFSQHFINLANFVAVMAYRTYRESVRRFKFKTGHKRSLRFLLKQYQTRTHNVVIISSANFVFVYSYCSNPENRTGSALQCYVFCLLFRFRFGSEKLWKSATARAIRLYIEEVTKIIYCIIYAPETRFKSLVNPLQLHCPLAS